MIILDTNVVSEPLRLRGDPQVTIWLGQQLAGTLFVTAVTVSELLTGVEVLPPGRRRDALRVAVNDSIADLFAGRILPFEANAAVAYASAMGRARTVGASIRIADGQIAAIALVHGFSVATRDAAPFRAAGVPIIDPWKA